MTPQRLIPLFLLGGLAVACVADVNDLSDEERRLLGEDMELEQLQQGMSCVSTEKGKKLGTTAKSGAGARSKKRCYSYVKTHMKKAGIAVPELLYSKKYGESAADFVKFAVDKPDMLDALGFELAPAGVVGSDEALPMGSVVVWQRGMCGYSPRHGHIEIVCSEDGKSVCSDFRGTLREPSRCGKSYATVYVPKGSCATEDSCANKEDGYYCSQLKASAAYECRNQSKAGATYCSDSSLSCGTPGERANVSGGTMQCQSGNGSSSGGSSSGSSGTSGGDPGDPDGDPGEEPVEGDSGEPSSSEGAWSCSGTTGTTIPRDGRYWITTFGASDRTSGTQCDDAGDNCIGACNQHAVNQGFCAQADVARPSICERSVKWFVADADRYGCGSRVRVDHNGKSVVALVIDRGPHCKIERKKNAPVLDASPAVNEYLTGEREHAVGEVQVTVTEVAGNTPLGPIQ